MISLQTPEEWNPAGKKGVNPTNKLYSILASHGGKRTAIKTHGMHGCQAYSSIFLTLHIQQLLKIWHRLHWLIRTWFGYITIAFAGRPLSISCVFGEHWRWSGRISSLRLRSGGKLSLRRSTVTGIQFARLLIFLGLPQGWMFVYSCARAKSQGIIVCAWHRFLRVCLYVCVFVCDGLG